MSAVQNTAQIQDLTGESKSGSGQSFNFEGKTYSFSPAGVREAFMLDNNLSATPDSELLEDLNRLLTRGGRSTKLDLKNHAKVTLPEGIKGVFPYRQFDVVLNPKFANQTLEIPLDKLYESNGKTYIFKGTDTVLPYALVKTDNGDICMHLCPLKVSTDTEVSIVLDLS